MSTGYLLLFYKNSLIESYIRNFLMTKYISLNNAIGANKLLSKIKYFYHNYFCFIDKAKNTVRCIIKSNKITNNQIDLKIKSQQELSLIDLKKSEIFKAENVIIQNFFNLDNNSDLIYLDNKINLLIKESNDIYEFNCILLEDSIDMGTFEKIKKCMKDKENNHTNEIQNNLRNNPFISNILNYQVFKNKNTENNKENIIEKNNIITDSNKNERKIDKNFFDMKDNKYFIYDELLIDKNKEKRGLFDKNKINTYIDLDNKYKTIFKISDTIFKKSFSELDDINLDINDDKMLEIKDNNIHNNTDNENYSILSISDTNNEINNNINTENKNDQDDQYKKEENNNYLNDKNQRYNIRPFNNYYSNNQRFNDRYKRYNKYDGYYNKFNNNYNYNNNYKRSLGNSSFSLDVDSNNNNDNYYSNNNNNYCSNNNNNYYSNNNNNYNRTDYNNKYYYNQNNDSYGNKFTNNRYYNKYRENNQYKNSYMNKDNRDSNYIYRRNDRYHNRYNDNMKSFSTSNNYSYRSSNNSYNSERSNFSRSRDKSPITSPSKMQRYNDNNIDSSRQNSYDNKFNDRNEKNNFNNNNYYGDNNNIN
jgi:hypothetical protein